MIDKTKPAKCPNPLRDAVQIDNLFSFLYADGEFDREFLDAVKAAAHRGFAVPPSDAPVAWQHSDGRLLTAGQLNSAASAIKDSWKNATPLYAASVSASVPPESYVPKKVLRDLINQMNHRKWDIHTTAHLALCLQSKGYDLNKDGTEVGAHRTESATISAITASPSCDCTKYNGMQCYNCLNGAHYICDSGRGECNLTAAAKAQRAEGVAPK